MLKTGVSRDAKDFVCRKLMMIGTAASVPALAALLPEKDLSHMARYALERIPAPEAAQALRDALPKLSGPLKVGVIGSLGRAARRGQRARAGRVAWRRRPGRGLCRRLRFGRPAHGGSRQGPGARQASERALKRAVIDASLSCAEGLLADGKKAEALAIYKSLTGDGQPKHVRLAATRGMLTSAGKKE